MAQAATQMRDATQAQNPCAEFHGTFCWNELMTFDEKAAKQFYANTIGWSFDPMPMDWAPIGSSSKATSASAAWSR